MIGPVGPISARSDHNSLAGPTVREITGNGGAAHDL